MRPATPAHIPRTPAALSWSKAAEDAPSPVSAKGEEIQSECWHHEHHIFTVTSEHGSRLTAHLPLDGQPSTTSQCSKLVCLKKKA